MPPRSASTARKFHMLRWPRAVAIVFCGVVGTFLPAVSGNVIGIRPPAVHDEFSYLLAADTFARGRMTNPAPTHGEFFEAPHILVEPTYSSKYPPGQGLALAVGIVVGNQPIWGVWITCGIFAAALCWMLQAWTSRRFALTITIVVITTLGMTTYWAQSYWGGNLAATGGALVFGALRRTLRAPRGVNSVVMATGVLILLNTRPYEGVLACLPAAVMLGVWFVHDGRTILRRKVRSLVLPFGITMIAGAVFMGLYNRAVTGFWYETPYQLHVRQYLHHGLFLFNELRDPDRQASPRPARFFATDAKAPVQGVDLIGAALHNAAGRLTRMLGSAFSLFDTTRRGREPYRGVWLWLAILTPVVSHRLRVVVVVGLVAAVIEALTWWYLPRYPSYLAPIVMGVWALVFLTSAGSSAWRRFIVATLLLVVAGDAMVWWFVTHYTAPVVPLILAGVAITMQRTAWKWGREFASRRAAVLLALLLAMHFITAVTLHSLARYHPRVEAFDPAVAREELKRHFEARGGRHLLFVRYAENFSVHDEWVYNGADLDDTAVLFAHDLGENNSKLIKDCSDRSVWLVSISTGAVRVEKYSQAEK